MPRIELPGITPPAQALPGFPPSFARLHQAYHGFVPTTEYRRGNLGEWLGGQLRESDIQGVENRLTILRGDPALPNPVLELLQRHYYWSATCFMRSFQLLLAYLVLERRALYSWGQITGYYSRFYSAKALVNLCLASWVHLESPVRIGGKSVTDLLIHFSNTGVKLLPPTATAAFGRNSHEKWWRLFDQLRLVPDFPPSEALGLAFQPWPFTLDRRHDLNYSDVWMRGFPELEWFDQSLSQMLSHANAFPPREDRDFTDLNRFFDGYDPEYADAADYYTDEIHWLWQPALAYLDLSKVLVPTQTFITSEKLIALADRTLREDFPVILDGMKRVLAGTDTH